MSIQLLLLLLLFTFLLTFSNHPLAVTFTLPKNDSNFGCTSLNSHSNIARISRIAPVVLLLCNASRASCKYFCSISAAVAAKDCC